MADEPNKRMDEMLKAYADKRRQDAGAHVELHPATRQLLQAEVTRTYRQAARASWLQRVLTFWPRVAFAGACLVITLTLVLIVLPRETVTEMAQTTTSTATLARDARFEDKEQEQAEVKLTERLADAPAPAASTAPVSPRPNMMPAKPNEADEVKSKSDLVAEVRKDADSLRLMREDGLSKKVARQSYENNAESSRARYQQQKREVQLGARLQNVQPILNNFDFEQSGDKVTITDEDGSVYSGNIISQNEAKKRFYGYSRNAPAPQGAAGPAGGEQELFFHVAGTNRSLKQQVSIEANIMLVQTNAVPPQAPANVLSRNQRGAAQNAIRGRAIVGTNQQELFIEALPKQP